MPPLTPSGAPAVDVLGDVCGRGLHAFHSRELDRLVLRDRTRGGVADDELDRRGDTGDRQRDQQPQTMDAVAPAAQHPDRVDRGDQEPCDQIRREDHVRNLVRHRRVEDHLPHVDRSDVARRRREPLRLVHPRVHGDDRERAPEARDHDRHAGPEVRPRREVLPAEDVDRDEDRLEEEEDPLHREQHAEHLSEPPGERRPEQPELEGEDGPGHRADRERHRHRLRPALREPQRVRIVAAQAPVVGDQHHRRQRNPQRRQDDVEAERERHLAPRRRKCRREHDHRCVHRLSIRPGPGSRRSLRVPRRSRCLPQPAGPAVPATLTDSLNRSSPSRHAKGAMPTPSFHHPKRAN